MTIRITTRRALVALAAGAGATWAVTARDSGGCRPRASADHGGPSNAAGADAAAAGADERPWRSAEGGQCAARRSDRRSSERHSPTARCRWTPSRATCASSARKSTRRTCASDRSLRSSNRCARRFRSRARSRPRQSPRGPRDCRAHRCDAASGWRHSNRHPINPGSPQRLWQSSYADYTSGNYSLAVTGFQSFLSYVPEESAGARSAAADRRVALSRQEGCRRGHGLRSRDRQLSALRLGAAGILQARTGARAPRRARPSAGVVRNGHQGVPQLRDQASLAKQRLETLNRPAK